MSYLQIIKASAGSGKTFALTREFLKLVLKEPALDYYRSVLAVTFTNKATAEMKLRIVKELYLLGYGEPSAHLQAMCDITQKDEKYIRNKSAAILNHILHGYSWFKIETIDSFFQGVVRSFLREIGIPGHVTTEIDANKILDEAIENFLDHIEQNKQVLDWLLDHIDRKISEGNNWLIKNEISKIGVDIFKEIYIEHAPLLEEKLENFEFLNSFKNSLGSIIHQFESQLSKLAQDAIDSIAKNGLQADDFLYKVAGPQNYFYKILNRKYADPNRSRLDAAIENPEKWASGKSPRNIDVVTIGKTILTPLAIEIDNIIKNNYSTYIAALNTRNTFQLSVLLSGLSKEINTVKTDKGIMLIQDSIAFIKRIINNNDAPFIYEKTGNRYNHILIDEFQDTSSLQYDNFKPLISNSLSNGHDCLVVGDIKQSIYRWRNSNWEVLAKTIKDDFGTSVTENTLDKNWRSDSVVIHFNNAFFDGAKAIFDNNLPEPNTGFIKASELYSDVEQKVPDKKEIDNGFVYFKTFRKDETENSKDYFGEELIKNINNLLAAGFLPGDIALLVRNKKEGAILAEFIIDSNKQDVFISNVGVISNESIFLRNSSVVKLLVAAIKFTCDTSDKLSTAELISAYLLLFDKQNSEQLVFPEGSFDTDLIDRFISPDFTKSCIELKNNGMYLLVHKLASLLKIDTINEELVYLHSFFDIVFQFSINEINDIYGFLKFWEEEGHKQTISAAESEGALKILTIHRSKGLEFPAVIVPFADWKITPKTNSILWIKPESSPFNQMPILPVIIKNELSESDFKVPYARETYLCLIDNLNLLYVAFTRAINALIVFTKNSGAKTADTGSICNEIVQKLKNGSSFQLIETSPDCYQAGKLQYLSKKQIKNNLVFLKPYPKRNTIPEIKVKWQSDEFLRNSSEKSPRAIGTVLHNVMEKIKVAGDIDNAMKQALQAGILQDNEFKEVQEFINKAINQPETRDWFSGKYTVLVETDILNPDFSIKRPDRIMLLDKSAIIVDYKFGFDEQNPQHHKQVKTYMDIILQMGFEQVKGFLWYVHDNNIVEVMA
jgi:ATP-dependent exoDNAse (exonuclease V) beta subunit